jgi:hypothetical protein
MMTALGEFLVGSVAPEGDLDKAVERQRAADPGELSSRTSWSASLTSSSTATPSTPRKPSRTARRPRRGNPRRPDRGHRTLVGRRPHRLPAVLPTRPPRRLAHHGRRRPRRARPPPHPMIRDSALYDLLSDGLSHWGPHEENTALLLEAQAYALELVWADRTTDPDDPAVKRDRHQGQACRDQAAAASADPSDRAPPRLARRAATTRVPRGDRALPGRPAAGSEVPDQQRVRPRTRADRRARLTHPAGR